MRTVTLAGIMVLGLGCAAQAQLVLQAQTQEPVQPPPPKIQNQGPPPAEASRFRFDKVNDGFVRFDSRTGKIAYCSPHTVGWSCQAVPEDRSALEQEIVRLHDEIAALRKQIDDLRAAPPPPPPAPPAPVPPPAAAPQQNGDITITLPSHEDIARARAYVEGTVQDTWRRLVEMIVNFKKDAMRNG